MKTRVESNLNVIWSLLVRIVLTAAVLWVLWRVRSILITVILSVMLAYVLLPAVDFMCSRRFLPFSRRGQRLAATVIVFVVFFAIVGVAFKLLFVPFENEAVRFASTINDYSNQLEQAWIKVQHWYEQNLPADWRAFLEKQDFTHVGASLGAFATGVIHGTLEWLSKVVEIVLIPVLAFYFVLDSRSLKREFLGMVPPRRVREALKITREVSGILQSYVVGQLILCLIAGIVTWVVLRLVGMDYALMLAVLAGVTRAIPVIGPLASGVPICILGALQSTALGLWLLVFVTIMHFAESKFVMPILIGDRMKLHPAVILIALLIGAEFFGLLGMFLAAPVAAIVRELIYIYIIRPRGRKQPDQDQQEMASPLIRSEIM